MSEIHYTPLELRYLWKKRGSKNYKLKDILMKGDFANRLIFEDVTNHRLVSGKMVSTPRQGENYHWPSLKHENLAPLIEIVSLNEFLYVFISLPVERSLCEIIQDVGFSSNPNCIDRKKAYAEDILWGLDYLHKKRLCLTNLSDKHISIQMLSDKAVIIDFSELKCAKLVKKNVLREKDFYNAPELYFDVLGEFDAIYTEMWACGELFLSLFTNHLMPLKLAGKRIYDALGMVEILNQKFLTLANPSVFISKAFVFDFKIFLCLFLQVNPEYRITAQNAAISTFLNRTYQRKGECLGKLWGLYDDREPKQEESSHSFEKKSDEQAMIELENKPLPSLQCVPTPLSFIKTVYKEKYHINSVAIENNAKLTFWRETVNSANLNQKGIILQSNVVNDQNVVNKQDVSDQEEVNNTIYEITHSGLQKCESLTNICTEKLEERFSILQSRKSVSLNNLFTKTLSEEIGNKQISYRDYNCMTPTIGKPAIYTLSKEVQTDICVLPRETLHSITIEQCPEMLRGSSSDSNLHNMNVRQISKIYFSSTQTSNLSECLTIKKENGNIKETAPGSSICKEQNHCDTASSTNDALRNEEGNGNCDRFFKKNSGKIILQSFKKSFSLNHERTRNAILTTKLNQKIENKYTECRQDEELNSGTGDWASPSFADFEKSALSMNNLKHYLDHLTDVKYLSSKKHLLEMRNISPDRIEEDQKERNFQMREYHIGDCNGIKKSQSCHNLAKLVETSSLDENSTNNGAGKVSEEDKLAPLFPTKDEVKPPSVNEANASSAKEVLHCTNCSDSFAIEDATLPKKKNFSKFKKGKNIELTMIVSGRDEKELLSVNESNINSTKEVELGASCSNSFDTEDGSSLKKKKFGKFKEGKKKRKLPKIWLPAWWRKRFYKIRKRNRGHKEEKDCLTKDFTAN